MMLMLRKQAYRKGISLVGKKAPEGTGILWFRQDLRLTDNPALHALARDSKKIIAVFIDDSADQTVSALGSASRVWLHHSLLALNASMGAFGGKLLVLQGDAASVLDKLIVETGADRLYWNRCYDPVTRQRDEQIKASPSRLKCTVLMDCYCESLGSWAKMMVRRTGCLPLSGGSLRPHCRDHHRWLAHAISFLPPQENNHPEIPQ